MIAQDILDTEEANCWNLGNILKHHRILLVSVRFYATALCVHYCHCMNCDAVFVFLSETGSEVVHATELVKEPLKFPNWEPPVKDDPQYSPPKTVKDDPDYHEDPVHEFYPECCLLEGTSLFFCEIR